MKAIICSRYGPPDDLRLGELPSGDLGPDEVRIAVHAAALNFPDLLMIEGKYQYRPSFPFAPGMECAGEVIEVGADVANFNIGDRVAAHPWVGCFAEQVVAPANVVYRLPEAMDFATAAAFTLAYGTVYHALADRAHLAAGEVVLVLGAAGGVGLPAIEFAKARGASVIAAASSAEKLAVCRAYGADHLLNYAEEPLRDSVRALTGDKGADVIFDAVGGDMTDAAMRCINWNGRLLIVGFASGRIAEIPANLILLKGCAVVGAAFQRFSSNFSSQSQANMSELFGMWQADTLKPHISQRLALSDAPEALCAIAERRATSKIVLDVR